MIKDAALAKRHDLKAFAGMYFKHDYQNYLGSITPDFKDRKAGTIINNTRGLVGLETGGGLKSILTLRQNAWDRRTFGFRVASVADICGTETATIAALLAHIVRMAKKQGIKLLTVRISDNNKDLLSLLQGHGFKVVDTLNILIATPNMPALKGTQSVRGIVFTAAQRLSSGDVSKTAAFARDAFVTGRIYNDTRMTERLKTRFYKRLVESHLNNPQTCKVIAKHKGVPVGVICCERDRALSQGPGLKFGYLNIIAVHPKYQDKKVAHSLFKVFFKHYADDFNILEVGTQTNNYPALNFYRKMGLKFVSSLVTLHLWP
ncbi:MAG: GNAT family N-acetyltransferase [Deltaproteobacteria bacterium]|nr:GNAT family N-acetyltransferase [Deltaproteobacteria bacterium]